MKTETIISGVISSHGVETAGICSRYTFLWNGNRCKQSSCIKIFPVLIQYFDWEKGGLQTEFVQSKPDETAQTVTHYVHGTLENNDLV
jgi:hypothetical protein